MKTLRIATRTLAALAVRPDLWWAGISQVRRLAPNGWYARWPFLPLPAREYLEFRVLTQYGDTQRSPEVRDVIDYLEWSRDWHSTAARQRRKRRV
jgi:hypothetical protein